MTGQHLSAVRCDLCGRLDLRPIPADTDIAVVRGEQRADLAAAGWWLETTDLPGDLCPTCAKEVRR